MKQEIDFKQTGIAKIILIIIGCIILLANKCHSQAPSRSDIIKHYDSVRSSKITVLQTVQDYQLIKNRWQPVGIPYQRPDTLTIIHRYEWKGKKIVSVQDLHKNKYDNWFEFGDAYPLPDSVTLIHALVSKIKSI